MGIEICNELLQLSESFKNKGEKLYIVGGYVRDYLLEKTMSEDIDICSALTVEDIENIKGIKVDVINRDLGTVVITVGEKKFEHTTFRVEYYGDNGKHTPKEVEFIKDIKTDSYRRDFTVNSIYYDIQEDKLIDFFGGLEDIEKRQIRAIYYPEYVFDNDGLRLLRMLRFVSTLKDFTIEEQTFEVAKKYMYNLKDITSGRVYEELKKILQGDNYKKALEYFVNMEIAEYVFKKVNFLPVRKYINEILKTEKFVYLKDDTPKEYRVTMFFMDICKMIYYYCYDTKVTLEGVIDFMTEKSDFEITSQERKNIMYTSLAMSELSETKDIAEIKCILLDYADNIKLIRYICEDEDYSEVSKIIDRLNKKGIALTRKEFCVKPLDIIDKYNLAGSELIGNAIDYMLYYGVINETNNKNELLVALDKYINGGK